jgi:hypothetical protein
MRIPDRETTVFNTSAIDLFAAALGAFILLVMVLFPFYRHAGPGESYSRTEALMEQRRLASGQVDNLLADQDQMQSETERLDLANQGIEQRIFRIRERLADLKTQLAELPVEHPEPTELVTEQQPEAITHGVEFSILGLATESRSFVIVIDMSGSMINYEDLMLSSVLDILQPLNENNHFALVGYQGNPQPMLWRFPADGTLMQGTAENLRQAAEFTRGLSRKFIGSTPTHFALQAALEYPANSIILVSDGEPNTPPGYIIESITGLNQFRRTELHTVAIGDYTHNRNLVLFMQTLARLNDGDFVGVSR